MLQMVGHYRTPLRARAREPSNFELDGARADAATSAKATASRLAHDDTASQRPDGVGQLPRRRRSDTAPAIRTDRMAALQNPLETITAFNDSNLIIQVGQGRSGIRPACSRR